MGRHHDDMLAEQQNFDNAVEEIAIRAGCLTRCVACGQVYDTGEDITAAYKFGNHLITQNDPLVAVFGGDRKAMTDAIENIQSEYAGECTYCCGKASGD